MLCAYAANAAADNKTSLTAALTHGQPTGNIRLRYEDISQDNALIDGQAFTLRTRLGYQTESWHGFDALAEYEGTHAIGGDDSYNSGAPVLSNTNNRTNFSTVADPTGNELNRAWLQYAGLGNTRIKLGRQRLIFDNARFIGNSGWRQNERTYDAISVVNKTLPNTTLTYAYLIQSNSRFYNDNKISSHLANLNWTASDLLKLSAYGYFIDFRDNDRTRRVPNTPDHRVLGVRATGDYKILSYALEYADQSDYADSPSTVNADYYLAELGLDLGSIIPKVGYELLAGDGRFGFTTAFANNQPFLGWADIFVNTPPQGVRDAYASLTGQTGDFTLTAVYHDFESDAGSQNFGSEIDLLISKPITERLSLLFKYADFQAENFAVDTRRYWLQAEYAF